LGVSQNGVEVAQQLTLVTRYQIDELIAKSMSCHMDRGSQL
jgi:hypothetical protein